MFVGRERTCRRMEGFSGEMNKWFRLERDELSKDGRAGISRRRSKE